MLKMDFTDTWGNSSHPINIDNINSPYGYIYRIFESSGFSGTSPTVVFGGNSYILIGFSSGLPTVYGVQMAFGYNGTDVAIRHHAYSESASWDAWRMLKSQSINA